MSADTRRLLQSHNYISFATRKRSGEFVQTPVWFAPDGDEYFLFSAGNAGKVKRLRNFSESRLAPCTVSGKVIGPWFETRAYLLQDPADEARALDALRHKYGWQMTLIDLGARLSGKFDKRRYIRVELVDS